MRKKFDVVRANIENAIRWHDCFVNYVEGSLDESIVPDGMVITAIDQMVQSVFLNLETQFNDLERMIIDEE